MDTKKKYGLLLLTLLAIVLSGCFEKLMVDRGGVFEGKDIPMEIRYKHPFKLGDTIWIRYSVGQQNLISKSGYIAEGELVNYQAFISSNDIYYKEGVSMLSSRKEDVGTYFNKKGRPDFPQKNDLMYYNPDTRHFEVDYGFVPDKRGAYLIQEGGFFLDYGNKRWVFKLNFGDGEVIQDIKYRKIVVE